MKKIEVREIRLTDFKGQSEKKIRFGHRTIVSGKMRENHTGRCLYVGVL